MKKIAVTIKEIAKQLEVSKSTVSRALRDSPEISEKTKEKVLQLAKALNYFPNSVALSLRKNRTQTIAVLVPDIANRFYSSTIAGIDEIAYSRGYHTMIYQSYESFQREVDATRHIGERRIDGLIVAIASQSNSINHFIELQEQGIPVVLFDRVSDAFKTHKVRIDDYKGAFDATVHLINQGCLHIAHIAGPEKISITKSRINGYKDALNEYGVPLREDLILHTDITQNGGASCTYQLMALKNKPDGILAASDRITTGVHLALRQLGYQMPNDVAVIGFCDLGLASLLEPPVSAVIQPSFEMGQQSVLLLLDLIESKNTQVEYETRVLDSKIVIQKSSLKVSL